MKLIEKEWTGQVGRVPLLRFSVSIRIIKFIILKDGNMKPESINSVKSVLAAGSILTTEGMFLSIIRFLKYVLHYMISFLCASEYKDGLLGMCVTLHELL